jgi:hypothetical protein
VKGGKGKERVVISSAVISYPLPVGRDWEAEASRVLVGMCRKEKV